jgi:VWFA-related protein
MRHTPFILACGIALGGTLLQPVTASQPGKPPPGARVAVVAFHDSRLLTVCPVFGKDVIESTIWTTGMAAKATVSYPPDGLQSIGLFFDDKTRGGVSLPMPVREEVRASAPAVAGALRSADRAMVVSFNSRVRVLSEFTDDRSAVRRALAEVVPGGGTRLYDALALVTVDRLRQVEGRKAVVLLTDGVDTHSQLTDAAGALAAIESSDTPVYVIRYETGDAGTYLPPGAFGIRSWLVAPDSPEKLAEAHSAADRFLMRLSSSSGGRLYSARPGAAVVEMLAQVGDDLSTQLTVGYSTQGRFSGMSSPSEGRSRNSGRRAPAWFRRSPPRTPRTRP